jgi:hypothetical protein
MSGKYMKNDHPIPKKCGLCIAIPEIWVANCDATPFIFSLVW